MNRSCFCSFFGVWGVLMMKAMNNSMRCLQKEGRKGLGRSWDLPCAILRKMLDWGLDPGHETARDPELHLNGLAKQVPPVVNRVQRYSCTSRCRVAAIETNFRPPRVGQVPARTCCLGSYQWGIVRCGGAVKQCCCKAQCTSVCVHIFSQLKRNVPRDAKPLKSAGVH
jgi:hypothetical protein